MNALAKKAGMNKQVFDNTIEEITGGDCSITWERPGNVSGCLTRYANGKYVMYIDPERNEELVYRTFIHELAHYFHRDKLNLAPGGVDILKAGKQLTRAKGRELKAVEGGAHIIQDRIDRRVRDCCSLSPYYDYKHVESRILAIGNIWAGGC